MQNKYLPYWLLFSLILIPICSTAQFGKKWSAWEELYKDQDIKVEIRIYTPKPNSCVDKNKKFKFKYRVTGTYKSRKVYLNWKIAYTDCNGLRYCQKNALDLWKKDYEDISGGITIPAPDKQFTGEKIDKRFYDIEVSTQKKEGVEILRPLKSKPALKINGLPKIYVGETLDLEVDGGVLGEGANWIWYIGGCGKRRVGKGKKVKLNIPRTTTVYVRAESKQHKTSCVQKTVEVDLRSNAPNAITGTTNICTGSNTVLEVAGGSLGEGAKWVWYKGNCGSNKLGEGKRISIQPTVTSKYFVRAESKLNTTTCATTLVTVSAPMKRPKKIQVIGSTSICQGESLSLTVSGNADQANYKWYRESCGGQYIGSGDRINITPTQTTTYFVRAESACNETVCLSKRIVVSTSSRLPSSITIIPTLTGKTLEISKDANLASDAKWKWYKNSCGVGGSVGTGSSIKIKEHRKLRQYFVKSSGNCPSVNCTKVTVYGAENITKKFQPFNTIHYGFSIGLEYNLMGDISSYSNTDIDKLEGAGIRGEVAFHPLMKDFFSLGILGGMSVGASAYVLNGGEVSNSDPVEIDQYFYTHFNLGVELALGFPGLKLIGKFNKELQNNDLTRTVDGATVTFDNVLNREYFGAGLRIGSYKKANTVDILYLLYQNNGNEFFEFKNNFSNLGNRLAGFQVAWKKSNKFSLSSNIFFQATHEEFGKSNPEAGNPSFHINLLINLNRFY
ncbi:MAG: hypothetical protein AB8G15_03770 [Saprospiraceae bacterium]